MTQDPWTADDPNRVTSDADLPNIDPEFIEYRGGDPSATFRILVSVEGGDARRLGRSAEAKGKAPHDVVAELLRDADRSAA